MFDLKQKQDFKELFQSLIDRKEDFNILLIDTLYTNALL